MYTSRTGCRSYKVQYKMKMLGLWLKNDEGFQGRDSQALHSVWALREQDPM